MDKYDYVILDIINTFRKNNRNQCIRLQQLEANFWTRIQRDESRHTQSAHLGERIANLYLNGHIVNRGGAGYSLTKKGKEELLCQVPG